jgi:alpha-1,3-mannosyl-glycoprotein beta-1,2-N-acetylglucosaminyltransferase
MGCPVIISQDGNNPNVKNVIQNYQSSFQAIGIPVIHLQHTSALRGGRNAYQALAIHYGWALAQVFDGKAMTKEQVVPQRVLILEEDIRIAVDFFAYFSALAPVLDYDRTLLAVSAFNDNGYQNNVKDPSRVLRSDFFPGLGWMLPRSLWTNELAIKWPTGYWDDWLREPAQRQDRHILRPEISRTFHFGTKGGASLNQFGDRLSKVMLNTQSVDWDQMDLSGLQLARYDRQYWSLVMSSTRSESITEALEKVKIQPTRLEYTSFDQFQKFARRLSLMDDEKAKVPRTAYRGIVEARPYGDHILFLTPPMKEIEASFVTQSR